MAHDLKVLDRVRFKDKIRRPKFQEPCVTNIGPYT